MLTNHTIDTHVKLFKKSLNLYAIRMSLCGTIMTRNLETFLVKDVGRFSLKSINIFIKYLGLALHGLFWVIFFLLIRPAKGSDL